MSTHRALSCQRWTVAVVFLWIVWFHGVFQLVSVARPVGFFNAGLLVQFVNPLVLCAILIVPGDKRFLIPRDPFQFLLLAAALVAAGIGIGNAAEGNVREYLSHLINALIGYTMYSLGRSLPVPVFEGRRQLWTVRTVLACSALSIAALHYLDSLGYIGRFAAEGYSLLLPLAHGVGSSAIVTLASLGLVGLSNKRGAYLMVAVVLVLAWLLRGPRIGLLTKLGAAAALIALLLVSLLSGTASTLVQRAGEHHFVDRTIALFEARSLEDLDAASSGRIVEMRAAVAPLDPLNLMVGAGFGYSYPMTYDEGVEVLHNTHFSPLTIALRHGLPFALFLYAFIAYWLLISAIEARRTRWTVAQTIPIFYLAGASVYSLTAYVVYVDLLFLFCLGHTVALTVESRRARLSARVSESFA